jgi:subtilisin family serine protease
MSNRTLDLVRPLEIILIILLLWLLFRSTAPAQAYSGVDFPTSVLIQFREGVTEAERQQILSEIDGRFVRWLEPISTAVVELPAYRGSIEASTALNVLAHVSEKIKFVELDGPVSGVAIQQVPLSRVRGNWSIPPEPVQVNDPDFNNAQLVYAPQLLRLPIAWRYGLGSSETIIAVIDSGISLNHPEFEGRIVSGYDFVNDDPVPADDHGHGTHVAGIIGAAVNNGFGTAGVCPNCRIMPIKVLNENNVGSWSGVAAGVLYAVEHGAQVINLSLGGTSGANVLEEAIRYAVDKGVIVVAAAGNSRSDALFFPAAYPGVLAVSATRNDDTLWSLSNYGDFVDVSAPGYAIYSTYHDLNNYYGGFTFMSGTSMAAPHVAGLAGLLLSQDPNRSSADIERLLTTTAIDLGETGKDPHFGYGRVDALAALEAEAPASVASGQLAGVVWQDVNFDDSWDQTEDIGLSDVTVYLRSMSGSVVTTTTTDSGGYWQINGLFSGKYEIVLGLTNSVAVMKPSKYVVDLGVGQSLENLNFSVTSPRNASTSYRTFIPFVIHRAR